jgi:hypothetical protein
MYLLVTQILGHAGPQGHLEMQFLAGQPKVPSKKVQQEFCYWKEAGENGHRIVGLYNFHPK